MKLAPLHTTYLIVAGLAPNSALRHRQRPIRPVFELNTASFCRLPTEMVDIDTDRLRVVMRAGLGQQPLDAVSLSTASAWARLRAPASPARRRKGASP